MNEPIFSPHHVFQNKSTGELLGVMQLPEDKPFKASLVTQKDEEVTVYAQFRWVSDAEEFMKVLGRFIGGTDG